MMTAGAEGDLEICRVEIQHGENYGTMKLFKSLVNGRERV